MTCLSKDFYTIIKIAGIKVFKINWLIKNGERDTDIWHHKNALIATCTEIGIVAAKASKATGKRCIIDIAEPALNIIFLQNADAHQKLIAHDPEGCYLVFCIGEKNYGYRDYIHTWPNHEHRQYLADAIRCINDPTAPEPDAWLRAKGAAKRIK